MTFTRRNFLTTLGASAIIAVAGFPLFGLAATSKKVVILGAGFGGSTTAKYLKIMDPGLDVTLIDRSAAHVSCAMSNDVIAGLHDISRITMPHSALADKYALNFVQAEVQGLDAQGKSVSTSQGVFSYDKLVVAPGIGFDYDEANGFGPDMQALIPHAYIGGPQTAQLRDLVQRAKSGDTILVRIPKAPYRCPPGPYERICLLSDLARERGFRVIALDANPNIISKQALFQAAFDELYKDVLTYIPEVAVQSFDLANKALVTDKGTFSAEVVNFIPEQRAGDLAFSLGLVPEGEKWAPIDPITFASTAFSDVHIIGDAVNSSIGEMPKSGTVANGMGKLLAENILRDFAGQEPNPPLMGNTCYSLVSGTEGIWISSVYAYDPEERRIMTRNGASRVSVARTEENGRNQESWGRNLLYDTFS